MEFSLDELDRRLVGALHIAPRAAWDDLAAVLGVDASTIARRFARLQERRVLRVVGQVDWPMFSEVMPVHVFIRSAGVASSQLVERICRFPQMQYVATTSGVSCVVGTLHAPSEDATAAILEELSTTPGIAGVESLPVLAVAGRGSTWDPRLLAPDERERCRVLAGSSVGTVHEHRRAEGLGAAERSIVLRLQQDGRASATSLGRAVGMSASTAHRVVRRLLDEGWVRPRVEIEPARLGLSTPFVLRARVPPAAIAQVQNSLAGLPETRLTTQVAGVSSIVSTGLVPDRAQLSGFINQTLAAIEGLGAIEIDVVLTERRRYWLDRHPDGGLGAFNPPPLL